MEKNMLAGSSSQPSAPPPTAPPSYEEAIANIDTVPKPLVNSAPYPVGPTAMPLPCNQPMRGQRMQMPMPMPVSPNCTSQTGSELTTRYNIDQNFTRPPEVRVIHQHVTYALGPNPVKMSCPTCHADIKTTTISDHQPSAHICCIILCLLGCCLCSCLPYCMSAFMSVHHFCPNCKNYIGTWKG